MIEEFSFVAVVCDCCQCRGRSADTPWRAYRAAVLGGWDVPAGQKDAWLTGYFRCPACVAADRWPAECDGLWALDGKDAPRRAPVIVLDEMPEALCAVAN